MLRPRFAKASPTFIKRHRRPTPPGRILRELTLEPRGISVSAFAAAIGVSRKHMSAVVNEWSAITARLAARIARALDTTPQYWLNLRNAAELYDRAGARRERPRDQIFRRRERVSDGRPS